MVPKKKGDTAAKGGLSREAIIAAALAIIDRDGYKGLSMRRLGKELGVDPMAIYYHIPSKEALLDGLVEVIMNEIDLGLDDPRRGIKDRVLTAARAYRGALLKHPSLIQAVVNRPPRTATALKPVEVLLGIFLDGGFKPEDAMAAVNIIATYVRGSVIHEAAYLFNIDGFDLHKSVDSFEDAMRLLEPEDFPNLIQAAAGGCFLEFEEEFDRGARAVIRGLVETYGRKGGD